ncbi:hypothetical protein SDRG_04504 [Saprolegnia diclina VS20]|uniref:Phosphoribosyl-AMP cyclohydrolase domain-containing protein n=1 Tax=Saprolegnia diclina (strain VS20) TaxID=1156394 RepID=T0QJ89_SAPDV|nr:hypothetical protein SDRG_04504 [Saprolegnia diclina VS20]EQC38074.1 hypothetical protein SDRG_04504 [Saprolegnia diclina VS20]|eukprot:XP_008608401.1 hypothetical protein SDRG_04504 [Saprolegnia diclina VS20]
MLLPIATTLNEAPLRAWSLLGPVYVRLSAPELSSAAFSPALLATTRLYVGPFSPDAIDAAVVWLDHGAHKAVFHTTYTALVSGGIALDLPADRVLLSVAVTSADVAALATTLPAVTAFASGLLLQLPADVSPEAVLPLRKALPEGFLIAVDAPGTAIATDVKPLHAQHLSLAAVPSTTDVVTDAFIRCLKSDRLDGLFTTVVTDASGVALGLVYSSAESILASVQQRRGIYYSRSRNGLWPKGDSSGHVQELIQLDMDCDSDALRFTVFQHSPARATTPDAGSFCHLETRTCWGPAMGIRHLQATLQDRKQSAPPGSYTKRLFDDMTLLRNKLVEEAQELAEATDAVHVAEEGADVLYFAMARCVAAGVSFQDIEHQLNMRARKLTRRPGNAKAYRIDAANAILAKDQ